jgi:3-hydroxyisobutyrate dehydrogenase-like beta-hydroxyacid dehydrogenase
MRHEREALVVDLATAAGGVFSLSMGEEGRGKVAKACNNMRLYSFIQWALCEHGLSQRCVLLVC